MTALRFSFPAILRTIQNEIARIEMGLLLGKFPGHQEKRAREGLQGLGEAWKVLAPNKNLNKRNTLITLGKLIVPGTTPQGATETILGLRQAILSIQLNDRDETMPIEAARGRAQAMRSDALLGPQEHATAQAALDLLDKLSEKGLSTVNFTALMSWSAKA